MTEDEWKAQARHVVREMQVFTAPFVSPISYEKPGRRSASVRDGIVR